MELDIPVGGRRVVDGKSSALRIMRGVRAFKQDDAGVEEAKVPTGQCRAAMSRRDWNAAQQVSAQMEDKNLEHSTPRSGEKGSYMKEDS